MACCGSSQLELPVLNYPGELPEWDVYLTAVYGPIAFYPIDLRGLEWLYDCACTHDQVLYLEPGRCGLSKFRCEEAVVRPFSCPDWHPRAPLPPGFQAVQLSFEATRDLFPTCANNAGHSHGFVQAIAARDRRKEVGGAGGRLQQFGVWVLPRAATWRALRNDTWIEVLRIRQGYDLQTKATWYYAARGSGIWLHSGRVCWASALPGVRPGVRTNGLPWDVHLVMIARQQGCDTVQHVWPSAPALEIIDVRSAPRLGGACGNERNLRAGWHAEHVCGCDENVSVLNCRGFALRDINAHLRSPTEVPASSHLELSSTDVDLLREYLTAIYPMGRFASVGEHELVALLRSRVWVYQLVIGSAAPLLRRLLSSCDETTGQPCTCKLSAACQKGELLHVDESRVYHELLSCSTLGGDCARRQGAYWPAWAARLEQRDGAFVEVWHMAVTSWWDQSGGSGRPQGWTQFFDTSCRDSVCRPFGSAGIWYLVAPGSGIFYSTGKMLTAPSKIVVLCRLLEEWLGNDRRTGTTTTPTVDLSWAGPSPRKFLDALKSIANGSQPCRAAGVPHCYDSAGHVNESYTIMDHYDFPLMELGRALAYDTLLITSSFLRADALSGLADRQHQRPRLPQSLGAVSGAELVDLRMPQTFGSKAWAALKVEQQAAAWVTEWQASERLSLRDPLNPKANSRPCAFNATPTRLLTCEGHASWQVRNTAPGRWRSCACSKPVTL